MQDHHNLRIWQRSVALAKISYLATQGFDTSERFGLAGQIRRAAVSIPSNIAEGSGRDSDREFVRFLKIAYGSACELETQALIAQDTGNGDHAELGRLIDEVNEVRRMLNMTIQRINHDIGR